MTTTPISSGSAVSRQPVALALTLCSLLMIGLSVGYLIWNETPQGRVEGTVVLTDYAGRPLSGCDVYLTPDKSDDDAPATNDGSGERRRRHTLTDQNGRFVLPRVAAGAYTLAASSKWHSSENIPVIVEESHLASRTLKLTRSEPDINVSEHQAAFTTGEKPFLPVRGYVSGSPLAPNNGGTRGNGTALSGSGSPIIGGGGGKKPEPLHIRIWRTRLSEVLKRSDAASDLDKMRHTYEGPTERVPKTILNPATGAAEKPQLVAETMAPIKSDDREGFYVERVKLDAAQGKPGLYLVEFVHGKKSVCSYVLVSDMALVTKRSRQSLLGYAVDMQKGTPVGGAQLRCYQGGTLLASGTTSQEGLGTLPLTASGTGDNSPVIVAVKGDDEAVVSRAGYWYGEETGSYFIHTVTDRTVYRPGDTVQYRGIVRLRRETPEGTTAYTVPPPVPVTVEVRDPNGALVTRSTAETNSPGGVWGSFTVSPEGATGTYTLVQQIGDAKFTSEVMVASYRKPEFTVTVTPNKARYVRGEPVEMTVTGTYYFGSPVAGAKVHYSVYRDADWQATYGMSADADDEEEGENFRNEFGGAYRNYYGASVADGDVQLDENGKAVVRIRTDIQHPEGQEDEDGKKDAIKPEDLPQAETYTLTAAVSDDAERSVEAEGGVRVSSGDILVSVQPDGYVATPNKAAPVYVTVRDQEGKPVANTTVTLNASFDRYDKEKKESITVPLGTPQTATTGADGRAYLQVTPTKSGEVRVAATAKDAAGRTVKSETNLWVTSENGDDLDTDYGDLSLLTDKRDYAPGDTARVLVNSSRTGQVVLVTVEGNQIYRTFTVPVAKHSTVLTVPVQEGWGPNVVLAACYVRNKHFASSQTPLRVANKARELIVTATPVGGERYAPGATVTYSLETKDAATGKPTPADCAFSVVDESIYALRPDDPKALRRAFYPHRSSRVSTSYSFSVEYLGDISKTEPVIEARRKFRDTAYWAPAVQTGPDGKATVTITLPDNLTTWRATVNAVSTSVTAVGYGVSKIISTKPFLVRLEKPRFLTGGDQSRLLAVVHNETGQDQTVLVHLQSSVLKVEGKDTQTLSVASGKVGKAEWVVSASDAASGDAPLRLTAWTPKEAGKTQYTDGVEQTLPTRAYGRTDFVTFAGTVDGTATPNTEGITPLGAIPAKAVLRLDGTAVPAETRLTLRVTPSLRGALTGGIEYLVGFPYGCTEQTLSRFYPDLLVQKTGMAATLKTGAKLPVMVRDGIARLANLQHSNSGGWGWWENDKDDAFMTAYALVGLSEARQQGYAVPEEMLSKGLTAAAKLAGTCAPNERPFLLYGMSVAGYNDVKDNLLHAPFRYSNIRTKLEPTKLTTEALAYLVLLSQRVHSDARGFSTELQRRAVPEGRLLRWKTRGSAKKADYPIGGERMATALGLRVLISENPNDPRIIAALRWLMQSRTDGYWGDTRDTSWVLAAFSDYLRLHPEDSAAPSGTVAVRLNGQIIKTIDLVADGKGEPEIVLSLPTGTLKPGPNTLELVRETGNSGTIFYAGALRQTLAAPKDAELPALAGQGLTVTREVLRVQSQKTGDLWRLATEPVTDGKFRQGDRLRVRLVITNQRDASYVLIEDAFPSGAEVTERGTAEQDYKGDNAGGFWYDHVDVRDDRIAFFARRIPAGRHVIEYNLRAQTPGVSRALPTHVEGMYDPTVKAESGGTKVEVGQ